MGNHFYWTIIIMLLAIFCCVVWTMYGKIRRLMKENNKPSDRQSGSTGNSVYPVVAPYKLDPHLLKNALSTIQSHAYHTYHALDKLSNVLDYILYESDDQFVKIKDEVGFAQNLIEINRLKVSPLFNLHTRKKISPEAGELLIAPFITINPIENAFKHADVQSESSFISVVFEVSNNSFFLSVSNKIQVNTMPSNREHGGVGNKAFKDRLDKLYGNDYHLTTGQKDGVYQVELEIKLQAND